MKCLSAAGPEKVRQLRGYQPNQVRNYRFYREDAKGKEIE